MVNKTMQHHVIFETLVEAITISSYSIFGCHKEDLTRFVLVVNYINKMWVTCHNTIQIFEVQKTSRAIMTLQLKDLLNYFDLCDKVILAYVKDEGANLNMFANALTRIVS
jgi:hypothetical protein